MVEREPYDVVDSTAHSNHPHATHPGVSHHHFTLYGAAGNYTKPSQTPSHNTDSIPRTRAHEHRQQHTNIRTGRQHHTHHTTKQTATHAPTTLHAQHERQHTATVTAASRSAVQHTNQAKRNEKRRTKRGEAEGWRDTYILRPVTTQPCTKTHNNVSRVRGKQARSGVEWESSVSCVPWSSANHMM